MHVMDQEKTNNSMTKEPEKKNLYYPIEDEEFRSKCKQTLKSIIFRGVYLERRYEPSSSTYRDVVALEKDEHDLEKLLIEFQYKCLLHFERTEKDNMWIGVISNEPRIANTLSTCIWTDLDNLAFGQYWFSIKSVRFIRNGIILKLKVVRPVEKKM